VVNLFLKQVLVIINSGSVEIPFDFVPSNMPMIDIIRLLRFPFSIFLLPVFLFAVSESTQPLNSTTLLLLIIWHVLVYPSSNAYNSYMDQDEGSIGGLKRPPKATVQVYYISVLLDVLALVLSAVIGITTLVGVLLYIVASRLYSYRGIRLKRFPIIGFLTVICFQGAGVFVVTLQALGTVQVSWVPTLAASLLIGGVYPLTQIYQHEADQKDGVKTISVMVGYIGTFILSACMFTIAMVLLYFHYSKQPQLFFILQGAMLPVIGYFVYWMRLVWKDRRYADFEHTMRMNVLASVCMNAFFVWAIIDTSI
jgi:1,4-dihydroxy-2-naphthoate octaprenyltransferase